MFVSQQHHDASRKRLRDEELESMACGFSEHRSKRLALPVRTSSNSQAQLGLSFSPSTQQPSVSNDRDMDMTMDALQDGQSFTVMDPTMGTNGRMPTPMQPNFAVQVRGNSSWTGPASAQMNGTVNMGHVYSGGIPDRSVPRTMQTNECWPHTVSHRIPSPIMEVNQSGMASPSMSVDSENHCCAEQQAQMNGQNMAEDMGMMDASAAQQLSFPNKHPRQPGNYEPYDPDESMPALAQSTSAPATPSPGRSPGHIRSRHTLNNWTQQAGMKKSFSIGYRADCDKCIAKVPGHFNHIVIS